VRKHLTYGTTQTNMNERKQSPVEEYKQAEALKRELRHCDTRLRISKSVDVIRHKSKVHISICGRTFVAKVAEEERQFHYEFDPDQTVDDMYDSAWCTLHLTHIKPIPPNDILLETLFEGQGRLEGEVILDGNVCLDASACEFDMAGKDAKDGLMLRMYHDGLDYVNV
jgi:hypothetical protein